MAAAAVQVVAQPPHQRETRWRLAGRGAATVVRRLFTPESSPKGCCAAADSAADPPLAPLPRPVPRGGSPADGALDAPVEGGEGISPTAEAAAVPAPVSHLLVRSAPPVALSAAAGARNSMLCICMCCGVTCTRF